MTKSEKHCDKGEIARFVTMFSKSRLLQRREKASFEGKG